MSLINVGLRPTHNHRSYLHIKKSGKIILMEICPSSLRSSADTIMQTVGVLNYKENINHFFCVKWF